MTTITNRYEFVYLFDVTNGNPNGDPDAGNLPRLDPETNLGLVTDVCIKRKIRNYVALENDDKPGHAIYMQDRSILNLQHKRGYEALGLVPTDKRLPKDQKDADALTKWMCTNFFDIRAFGAVMTTGVNCGQVRGPVQIAFAQSIDPIIPMEISITRMAVTTEADSEKQVDNRTMGRKHIVPYGLYRMHGFISANLAARSGFSEDDLETVWRSLTHMFEHDRSAARGEMTARKLIVFKHESALGNAPAHTLFDAVSVTRVRKEGETEDDTAPARRYSDYTVVIDHAAIPAGIEVIERI